MNKIKNIEFLRIIGTLSIVLHHMFRTTAYYNPNTNIELFRKMHFMTANGYLAVELFFILSGFFFVITYKENINIWNFIKKKLIRLYPVMIFTTLLFAIVALCGIGHFSFYDNILSLFFVYGTGINYKPLKFTFDTLANLDHLWYVTTMFWGLILLFYLHKIFNKKYINLIVSISIFISYFIIFNLCDGKICHFYHSQYDIGLLRAIGGLGIGYFIGNWYITNKDKLSNLKLNSKTKYLLTGLEFYGLYFIINNLILHHFKYNNNFIYIIFFIVTILLFLIKQGLISQFLSNDILPKLSKYCYSIYVTHMLIFMIVRNYMYKDFLNFTAQYPSIIMITSIILVILLGIFTYHCVEKNAIDYFKNKII